MADEKLDRIVRFLPDRSLVNHDRAILPPHVLLIVEKRLSPIHEYIPCKANLVMAWAAAVAILAVGLLSLYDRRASLIAMVFALVVGGIIAVATVLQPSARENTKDAIAATASVDPAACPDPQKPIRIEFRNGNDGVVQRASFSLIGRVPGHSSIVYRGFLRDDKIIPPGETSVTCFGLLPLGFAPPRPDTIVPQDYEWSVDISLVDFAPR